MITGLHAMFYSSEAQALREFMRDVLEMPAHDVGGGWLIMDGPEAELAAHPVDHEGAPPSGTHDISFSCDDIEATVAKMKGKGVEFTRDVRDDGFGFTTHFLMPGGVKVQLYQPKYKRG